MEIAFTIIISLLGMAYAFWTKQTKIALGMLLLAIAFMLNIPDITTGFWVDILLALSLMVFTVGVFIIVWKKKEINDEVSKIEKKEKSASQDENK